MTQRGIFDFLQQMRFASQISSHKRPIFKHQFAQVDAAQ